MNLRTIADGEARIPLALIGADKVPTHEIQSRLADLGLLDPPGDGSFGIVSFWATDQFLSKSFSSEQNAVDREVASSLLELRTGDLSPLNHMTSLASQLFAKAVALSLAIVVGCTMSMAIARAQVPAPPDLPAAPTQITFEKGTPQLAVGDSIVLTIPGIDAWRKRNPTSSLTLYVNGHPLSNVSRIGEKADQIAFDLKWTGSGDAHWPAVIGKPDLTPRRVKLRIGPANAAPFEAVLDADFVTISRVRLSVFFGFVALIGIAFVVMARKSDILRDPGPSIIDGRRPYSLARTQMAVWFFLVIAAFIFILVVTDTYEPLTSGVLILSGISVGTGLGAAVIDRNKKDGAEKRVLDLDVTRAQLTADLAANTQRLADLALKIAALAPGQAFDQAKDEEANVRLDNARKREQLNSLGQQHMQAAIATLSRRSERFIDDILTDENGISFHRFQIAIWTIVLAVLFVYVVYATLSMPDFDAKLLALMGISSGTYLGFKIPEIT